MAEVRQPFNPRTTPYHWSSYANETQWDEDEPSYNTIAFGTKESTENSKDLNFRSAAAKEPASTKELLLCLQKLDESLQYNEMIRETGNFLKFCLQLGPDPVLTGTGREELGLFIWKTLSHISACLVDRACTLGRLELDYANSIRSGLEFLLTSQSYRELPIFTDKTLETFLDDFKDNASAIHDFDDHLRFLSRSIEPYYLQEVKRPQNVPQEHWWWGS